MAKVVASDRSRRLEARKKRIEAQKIKPENVGKKKRVKGTKLKTNLEGDDQMENSSKSDLNEENDDQPVGNQNQEPSKKMREAIFLENISSKERIYVYLPSDKVPVDGNISVNVLTENLENASSMSTVKKRTIEELNLPAGDSGTTMDCSESSVAVSGTPVNVKVVHTQNEAMDKNTSVKENVEDGGNRPFALKLQY